MDFSVNAGSKRVCVYLWALNVCICYFNCSCSSSVCSECIHKSYGVCCVYIFSNSYTQLALLSRTPCDWYVSCEYIKKYYDRFIKIVKKKKCGAWTNEIINYHQTISILCRCHSFYCFFPKNEFFSFHRISSIDYFFKEIHFFFSC